MHKKSGNSYGLTPTKLIDDIGAEEKEVLAKHNKGVFLLLNDEEGHYDIAWLNAGMTMIEIVAFLEIAKAAIVTGTIQAH